MSFDRFTERARFVVVQALDVATQRDAKCVGTEHLLIGLLREEYGVAAQVLAFFAVAESRIEGHLVEHELPDEDPGPLALPLSRDARKTCELALREALSLGHNYIGTEHILLGLARNTLSPGARLLAQWMGPYGRRATDGEVRKEVMRTLLAADVAAKRDTRIRRLARLAEAKRDCLSQSLPGRVTLTIRGAA